MAQRSGWNPPPRPTRRSLSQDPEDLEALLYTGTNYQDVVQFLGGSCQYLGPNAILVDAGDRVLLIRVDDWILRYPNGTIGRCRAGGQNLTEAPHVEKGGDTTGCS